MDFSLKNTIKCLTILELPDDKILTSEDIRSYYRRLCLVYHPDQSIERYKDGVKFREINEAQQYLITNLDNVNRQISSDFGADSGVAHSYSEDTYHNRDYSYSNNHTNSTKSYSANYTYYGQSDSRKAEEKANTYTESNPKPTDSKTEKKDLNSTFGNYLL